MTRRRLAACLAAACLVGAWLGGCGGSQQANGGIGGSGISDGAITGFGSIFVTGTEYDLSGANVVIEHANGSESDLRMGMVVEVEGERSEDGLTGTASQVTFDDEIEGPIAFLHTVSEDVVDAKILGQVVRIDRGVTLFDDSLPLSFDTLARKDVIEVSGFRDGEGRILATFVKKTGVLTPGATPHVELKGTVSSRSGTTFAIGPVIVTFDGSTKLSDLPPDGPQNGDFVEVEGAITAPDAVRASRIEREGGLAGDVEDVELEGLVSGYVTLDDFELAGQPVDASGADVVFEPDDPEMVADGARLEIEGSLQAGVLIARKVKLRGGQVRVHAELAEAGDVDPAAGTLVLLGIEIHVDAETMLKDQEGHDREFTLADLTPGDFLEVRGIEQGDDSVLATQIFRKDSDTVRLRGRVEAIDAVGPSRSVTILGVQVRTDSDTDFEGFWGQNDFYASVQLGDLLNVRDLDDADNSAIDVADTIELEQDDD